MRKEDIEDNASNIPNNGPTNRKAAPVDGAQESGGHGSPVAPRTLRSPFNLAENRTDLIQEITAGVLGWLSVASNLPIYAQLFIGDDDYSVNATGEGFLLAAALSTVMMGVITNLPIIVAPSVLYTRRSSFSVGDILAAQFVSNFCAAVVMGSALRLSLVSYIPTALRVGAGCGISILVSALGGRSMGLLTANDFALPKFTWELALGLLIITGSCISWPTRQKWPLLVGIPIAVTTIVYAVFDRSKFEGYSSFSPLSEWSNGTMGLISFNGFLETGFYWIYILRTSFSIVINVSSILLILVDAICLQDMRKIFKVVAETDIHEVIGVSKKFRLMGTLIPVMSMLGNVLGVTTQAAFVQTMVSVFAGARTGLASIVTGTLFFVSMFIWPLHAVLAPGHVTGALAVILSIRFFSSIKIVDLSYLPHGLAVVMPLLVIPFTFDFVDSLCIAAVMSFLCEQGQRMLSEKGEEAPGCDVLVHRSQSISSDLSVTIISTPPVGSKFGVDVRSPVSHSGRNATPTLNPVISQMVCPGQRSVTGTSQARNCASTTMGDVRGCCNGDASAITPRGNTAASSARLHPAFALVAFLNLLLKIVDERIPSSQIGG